MLTIPCPTVVTPEEAAQRLAERTGLAWIDANAAGDDPRWSFVGVEPVDEVRAPADAADPFACIDELTAPPDATNDAAPLQPADVPRWIGFVAYDACWSGRAARMPRTATGSFVSFRRYDALYAFDHARRRAFVVGDGESACTRLAAMLATTRPVTPRARVHDITVDDPMRHLAAIELALDHIRRGDIYQVNLARRWRGALEGPPLALYLAMRQASPVPLGLHLEAGDRTIMSCTMERFLRWTRAGHDGAVLETRPIKGTRTRSGTRDAVEADTLTADPKERAEHVMIVDLMRNDLGRVAKPGSVRVAALLRTEPYAGLHHLVSTVRCVTRSEVTLRDVVEATFPPGSVTGAPKLRAVEIIEALEPHPRDLYTGAVGFVDRAGGLSLAVAIRTAVATAGAVDYWAGGGIVEASDPARELAETELKARVFLDAVARLEREDTERLSPAAAVR